VHTTGTERVAERTAVRLSSPAAVEAVVVPSLAMLVCSLRHDGQELLEQRGGAARYAATGSTMGIPLLHPWANRLAADAFTVAGRRVDLAAAGDRVHRDPAGLPIHGLLALDGPWLETAREADADRARVAGALDLDAVPALAAAFPFPHRVGVAVELRGARLTIATTLDATGPAPVPVAFGHHPYLRLPGVGRDELVLGLPPHERLELDDRGLPTGRRSAGAGGSATLAGRVLDDALAGLEPGARFTLAGAGRRIAVTFDAGYPFGQLYAPADGAFCCIEPMTAPTNALIDGTGLRMLPPRERFEGRFTIAIDEP
jgi:galactose mutarotase-like enzyme